MEEERVGVVRRKSHQAPQEQPHLGPWPGQFQAGKRERRIALLAIVAVTLKPQTTAALIHMATVLEEFVNR